VALFKLVVIYIFQASTIKLSHEGSGVDLGPGQAANEEEEKIPLPELLGRD
jgi:hypothetical protein